MRRPHPLLLLPALALVGCPGPGTGPGAVRAHLERPRLEVDSDLLLPGPTTLELAIPEDPAEWNLSGREHTPSLPGEFTVAGGKSGEEVLLEIPGPFRTRDFNQVALTGVFPGVFEVLIQLDGGAKQPYRHPALTTRKQGSAQTLLFDLESLRGRQLKFERLRILVRGPQQPFTLQGVDLIDLPGHQLLPSLTGPPGQVVIGQESRPAQGLPPGVEARCTFMVESEHWHLSLAAGILPRLRPPGGEARIEVMLVGSGGATWSAGLDLVSVGPHSWSELQISLSPFVGEEVTATFEYSCSSQQPGVAALGDLRVWGRGHDAPTVLLVSSDTHRADHLAAMNLGVELETPALDLLAARGLVYERAWASTNVTSPSHVAILTALHPRDTRLVSNQDALLGEAWTLSEAFQDAGWRTLQVVSVRHLGPRGTNLSQGFDQVLSPTSSPWRAEVAAATLTRWIDEAAGLPTFAFLHIFDAHHPYEPPASHDRLYYPKDRDPYDEATPAIKARRGSMPMDYWGRLRDVDYPKAQYKAEVTYLDGVLGGLFEIPRVAAGLIAFTSDHGEILEKAGTYFNHGELYPDTLHVPMVLGGGSLPPELRGRRCTPPVSQLGLGRTLLDLSGLVGTQFPGRNILHALDGEAPQSLHALSAHGLSASILKGNWYLLLHLKDHQGPLARRRTRHQAELFDLANDPECLHDISAQQEDRTQELRGQLITWLEAASPTGLSVGRTSTAEELAALKSMGYATEESVLETPIWYEAE